MSGTPSAVETEEPAKRRPESRSNAAKKAAKVRARFPRSEAPLSEYPMTEIPDDVPVEWLREAIAELGQPIGGYKATSEAANSSASRI